MGSRIGSRFGVQKGGPKGGSKRGVDVFSTPIYILLIWTVPADREDLACLLPIEEGYTCPYGGKFAQSESSYS